MALTPEQKQQISTWVANGDNLSAIQQKISSEFQISMTYMDVRFLVDDLNLELKDPKPATPPPDLSKQSPAARPATPGEAGPESAPAPGAGAETEEDFEEEALPPVPGEAKVTIALDGVTLIPGAMASGSVTFSDGVTGKWIVDQYGRPGFTEISQPGYRPSAADAQAFMRELTLAIQGQGY